MSDSVAQIAKSIEALPPGEQEQLFAWLDARRSRAWDDQIASDSEAGRLDFLIEEARADYRAGRCRPMDDLVNDES
jgi:hypothetical protein